MREEGRKALKKTAAAILACLSMAGGGCRNPGWIPEETGEAAAEEKQEIVIWEYDRAGNFQKTLSELAEKAEAESIGGKQYRVTALAVPEEEYEDRLLEAYAEGKAPDIVLGSPEAPSVCTGTGAVIDLSPLRKSWEEKGNPYLEELPDAAWEIFRDGRIQTGIPAMQTGYGILYNREIFDKAGIEKLPETYEEWKEACEKISFAGAVPWVNGTDRVGKPSQACMLYWLGTNQAFDSAEDIAELRSPAFLEVWEFYQDNIEKGYQPENILQYTEEDARALFLEGKAAMYAGGAPHFIAEEEKFGVLPAVRGPSAEDGPCHFVSYKGYYALRSSHSEDTLAVLKWWYEHNDELWTEEFLGYMPCLRQTAGKILEGKELLAGWAEENIYTGQVSAAFRQQDISPACANELLSGGFMTAVPAALYAGGSIEEGTAKAEYEIQRLLEKYAAR